MDLFTEKGAGRVIAMLFAFRLHGLTVALSHGQGPTNREDPSNSVFFP